MRKKILALLKNTDGYISGEKIRVELGISRAAVWKHINKLKSEGYGIKSVTNKGYSLLSEPDIINADAIQQELSTEFIGRNIFYYDETDTTNERAKANSAAPDGSVFIAEIQTAGKGTRGRGWVSSRGDGIYHSILLKPDILPFEAAQITLVAGLAVCRSLGHGAQIKWPNDIVINGKKLCGILTEMSSEKNMINSIVCGIGVNVNTESFPEEISHRATSMYIESGQKFERNALIAKILNEFERCYKKFLDGGLETLLDDYRENCVTIGRAVNVISKKENIAGTAVGLDTDGSLLVETDSGTVRVSSGEVSVRGIYGYV